MSAEHEHDEHEHHLDAIELVRIGLVALAVLASWLHPWRPFARLEVISLVATIVGGYPIWKEAFEALVERRMTMELSMTIAIGAALAIRESFTASVIVLFVLVAEVLEHQTVGRGRRAIKHSPTCCRGRRRCETGASIGKSMCRRSGSATRSS